MVEWLTSDQLVQYDDAIKFMEERVQLIHSDLADELIWLLEHPPLYTAGINASDHELIEKLFPIYQTGRGGKYTYHGPGQRVVYLMINLKKRCNSDIKLYIKYLSHGVINTLKHFNILGKFQKNRIGIWIDDHGREKKIAAFGIRVRKWITYHGLAINVSPNLAHYQGIIPCGLQNYGVTSLDALGVKISLYKLDILLKKEFNKIFKNI